jgi:hypothetical protein
MRTNYNILSRIGVGVTNNSGFWIWFDLLALLTNIVNYGSWHIELLLNDLWLLSNERSVKNLSHSWMKIILSLRENLIENTASNSSSTVLHEYVVSETCMNRYLAKWIIPCPAPLFPLLAVFTEPLPSKLDFRLITETCVSEQWIFRLSGLMSQYLYSKMQCLSSH